MLNLSCQHSSGFTPSGLTPPLATRHLCRTAPGFAQPSGSSFFTVLSWSGLPDPFTEFPILWNLQGCITVYLSRFSCCRLQFLSATTLTSYHSLHILSIGFLNFFVGFWLL